MNRLDLNDQPGAHDVQISADQEVNGVIAEQSTTAGAGSENGAEENLQQNVRGPPEQGAFPLHVKRVRCRFSSVYFHCLFFISRSRLCSRVFCNVM